MWNVQAYNYSWSSATKAWLTYNLCQQQHYGQGHGLTVSVKSSGFDSDSTIVFLHSLEENKLSESFQKSQTKQAQLSIGSKLST